MRVYKHILLQVLIVLAGVSSILVLRSNVKDLGVLASGDETAIASVAAPLDYRPDKEASWILSAETVRETYQRSLDMFGIQGVVVLATSEGRNQYASGIALSSVRIDRVLEGDPALQGRTIDLLCGSQARLSVYEAKDGQEARLVFSGAQMNYLKKGHTYLMLLDALPMPGGAVTRYQIHGDSYYDLEDTENRLVTDANCLYRDYAGNEVFAQDEEMLRAIMEQKQDMLSYYSVSETKPEG